MAGDRKSCRARSDCVWLKQGDGACVDALCENMPSKKDCQIEDGCIWEDKACRQLVCTDRTSEADCTTDRGCLWESKVCRAETCTDKKKKGSCNAREGCIWDSGACRDDTCADHEARHECLFDWGRRCTWRARAGKCEQRTTANEFEDEHLIYDLLGLPRPAAP